MPTPMGVGIGCAKCHDHKFDPIPQEDYYKIKAMLAPVSWKFDIPLATPAQQKRYTQQLEVWKEATEDLRKQIDAIVEPRIQSIQQEALIKFPAEIQAIFAKKAIHRSPYEQQLMDLANIQLEYERERFNESTSIKGEAAEKLKALRKALNAYATLKPKKPTPAFVASDVGSKAPRVMLMSMTLGALLPTSDATKAGVGFFGLRVAYALSALRRAFNFSAASPLMEVDSLKRSRSYSNCMFARSISCCS